MLCTALLLTLFLDSSHYTCTPVASASHESNSGSSSASLSAGECGGDITDELETCSKLMSESDEMSDRGGVLKEPEFGIQSIEEAGELNKVGSEVVAQLGVDNGTDRFDGRPIFLALVGLEPPFFSLERV